MFSIKDYDPIFYNNSKDVIEQNRELLKNLEGKIFNKYWVVWETNDNEWSSSKPVVLSIGEDNVEVCCTKLNNLSITWNKIDIEKELESYDLQEYGKFDHEWRENCLEELNKVRNSQVVNIELIEYRFNTQVVWSGDDKEKVGMVSESWILNGIGFRLSNGYFSIYNALDTNGIGITREDDENIRYIKI